MKNFDNMINNILGKKKTVKGEIKSTNKFGMKPLSMSAFKSNIGASEKMQSQWRNMSPKMKNINRMLFKDSDGDCVPNKWDCQPRNRMRQDSDKLFSSWPPKYTILRFPKKQTLEYAEFIGENDAVEIKFKDIGTGLLLSSLFLPNETILDFNEYAPRGSFKLKDGTHMEAMLAIHINKDNITGTTRIMMNPKYFNEFRKLMDNLFNGKKPTLTEIYNIIIKNKSDTNIFTLSILDEVDNVIYGEDHNRRFYNQ